MNLAKKLLDKFNGLHYPQEYLCLARETFEHPLHAYLLSNKTVLCDITEQHVFAGYSPLIFAFAATVSPALSSPTISLGFSQETLKPNDVFKEKDAIAGLSLSKFHELNAGGCLIYFFEGVKGTHRFIPGFSQAVGELNNRLYKQKAGNVFLPGNLLKQVQIAYSIPRKICLATVGKDNLYNLFPTDLHGQVGDLYLISLRHEGKACMQVESSRRVVLSDMKVTSYKHVYSLGKNHMLPLKERSEFDWEAASSEGFGWPLPIGVTSYKELKLENSFPRGIHKLLLFKIVHEKQQSGMQSTLSHIHNCYATWRFKHGISSNLLMR